MEDSMPIDDESDDEREGIVRGVERMNLNDEEEIEVQDWIKNMSTKELRVTINEIASIINYGNFWPGGYVLPRVEKKTGRNIIYFEVNIDVNENNREMYEKDLAIFLINYEKQNN